MAARGCQYVEWDREKRIGVERLNEGNDLAASAGILTEEFYESVKLVLETARKRAYSAVNFAMVEAYWEIGKNIVEEQGGAGRAEYGRQLIKKLAAQLGSRRARMECLIS